ncbi:MAG: cytochrome c [Gammaproteobacteria bacterium]
MKFKLIMLVLLGLLFGGGSYWMFAVPDVGSREIPRTAAAIERGAYLVTAGGCVSCHAGQREGMEETLAGGLALESDFGTFYAPNITPDPDTGIGNWTGNDFLLALKHGRTPSGSFYYPAFPYRAYSGLTDRDVLAMAAYLQSLEPVSNSVPEAETPAWLNRWAVAGWNKLADFRQPEQADFDDEQLARGAYLARNLGHCGECHTPRDSLGIPDLNREYAGATMGEDTIEAIDADALVDWSASAFDLFLLLGLKPNDEFVGGEMSDVIEHNTSLLTDEDRMALAIFFTRHNPPQ